MFRNTNSFSVLILSVLFLTQCQNKPVVTTTPPAATVAETPKESEIIPEAKKQVESKPTAVEEKSTDQKNDSVGEFVLDIDQHYVPVVETCVYIRSAPNLDNSTIIQCLIPERSAEFVTGMAHHLKPTGNTDGDWAEFEYWFDVYTMKPDPQDSINFDTWTQKRDVAHKAAREKYRTFRKKGWLKYRNNDGTSKVKIVDHG